MLQFFPSIILRVNKLASDRILANHRMVRHEYWDWASNSNEYAKRVDDYRKTLVQILGGAFLLYTLYLTLRRTKAAEETLLLTQNRSVTLLLRRKILSCRHN